jgi:NADPH2:quinone reductase
MKAYVYGANGAQIADVAKPAPKGAQVLVRVRACGLNRADLGMTKGQAHGSAGGAGTVLGMEWAGEVAELGPDAKGVKVGDRIIGSGGAAFAEYTLADHGRLFGAPSNMNFEDAATLPVALTTMHNAVVTNGALQPGQSVLIQGASSGVGLMAMQIARLKGAGIVIGSSTDAVRRGRLKQ